MKWLRWAVLALVLGALAAFAAGLLSPRRGGPTAYRPPRPATDNRAALPG